MSTFKIAASKLLDRGFSVIPVRARAKVPILGALSRTRDTEQVFAWASSYPDANIGIVSDDTFTILETDDAVGLLAAIEAETGMAPPPTACITSGRPNRCAWIYRRTEACGSDCLEVPGIFEFRNRNQYILGPGSIHPDGMLYHWLDEREAVAIPDWLVEALKRLDAAYKGRGANAHVKTGPAERLKAAYMGRLDPQDMLALDDLAIEANERHYTLLSIAGLLHDGERSEEEITEILSRVRDAYCDAPEEKGDDELRRIAFHVIKRDPFNAEPLNLPAYHLGLKVFKNAKDYEIAKAETGENGFAYPRVPGVVRQYVLLAKNRYDGWFPRGRPSLIAGASGSGKTTLIMDIFEKQSRKEEFLGHPGAGLNFLVCMADRGVLSNEETLERMGINPLDVPIEYLPVVWGAAATDSIKYAIEKRRVPKAVFIEGADMLLEDPNSAPCVAPFLKRLQEIAAYYHIALILSVGSGKMSKKDGYTLTRDRVFGSQVWGRMTETLVFLSHVGDGTGPDRKMSVEHRNEATERFDMSFENGRLRRVFLAEEDNNTTRVREWAAEQLDWWTRPEAAKSLAADGMQRTVVYAVIKELLTNRKLLEQRSKEKKMGELKLVQP